MNRGERELTAQEHRIKADEHEARADAEARKFDPSQTREAVARSPFADVGGSLPDGTMKAYNPTSQHLQAADREMRAAANHDKAAAKLEAFEDAACEQIPSRMRASCPLLASQVSLVQNDKKGVLLTIKDGSDAKDIEQMLQCHLAFARANGFDRPTCPLFVKGMTIRMVAPKVLALEGNTPEIARQLQAQAHRIFTGPTAPIPVSSIQ
ncbi:MAG: hypothetical protein JNK82_12795 [Myxococcaceae bacterium]|nr:hypothetical protein [Myxococcaceae bacterium]